MANKQGENQGKKSGNFADDREKASEAGKKGGQQSHQGSGNAGRQPGSDDTAGSSQQSGGGNFANDRERASEAGRKGGEHSHGK